MHIKSICCHFLALFATHSFAEIIFRPLEIDDYYKGFLAVFKGLSGVSEATFDTFQAAFNERLSCNTLTLVAEDTEKTLIVGSASLIVERKFIHNCANKGYLEDVVILEEYKGRKIGVDLVNLITEVAREQKCYKIILTCEESLRDYYSTLGYKPSGMSMRHYMEKKIEN
ncbi:glucosamine-phosphate N-acetyltransferase [Enteropsectra breve]|nr:glucosamine-phosphate N-acetyltransferase [Enteropsectra breve]